MRYVGGGVGHSESASRRQQPQDASTDDEFDEFEDLDEEIPEEPETVSPETLNDLASIQDDPTVADDSEDEPEVKDELSDYRDTGDHEEEMADGDDDDGYGTP